jgi:benzoyl-CoA-dihydrodiol lyase
VPLLGVLPGTGGLTRLTDKRRVRRDHADVFCTTPDGVKGARAREWRLVDHIVRTQEFGDFVKKRAVALAEQSDRPTDGHGIKLMPLDRKVEPDTIRYRHGDIVIDRTARTAAFTVTAPTDIDSMLLFARELDDAILHMRTNELEIGLWLFKTTGDSNTLVRLDQYIVDHQDDWYVREVLGMMRRMLQRLEVSSRSMFSIVTPGSCFAGTLLELALAADRIYMLQTEEDEPSASLMLSPINFGSLPMVSGQSRLGARFYDDASAIAGLREEIGIAISAPEAVALGLVTDAPDALDWDDELRQAIESRVALSPDALTGMEANLRFGPSENQATRIFGRLSAWQNWIFIRPNATGEKGALKVYGSGAPPKFDWDRV